MIFFYINNVLKAGQAARGRQIYENENAFRKIINANLRCWSADTFFVTRIFTDENNLIRKFFFHLFFFIRLIFLSRNAKIYSRNLSLVYLANKLGFSVFWEAHDMPKGKNSQLLNKLICKIKVISISNALSQKLQKDYQIPLENILVAHDGVDIQLYDEYRNFKIEDMRKKFGLPIDTKIILHSGTIKKERGTALFKDVLEQLPEWTFVQVGGSEADLNSLKSELSSYKNFMVLEHQTIENLIQIQLCSDALFYMITKDTPTYWCCSPMKIFEFLACGKPIVASDIGSLSEIISKNNAFTFEPFNAHSLKNALLLLNQKELCESISKNSLHHVRQNYTWDIRAKSILRFAGIVP